MNVDDKDFLVRELTVELCAKRDGSGKNLIAKCPYCGKEGKFGIYIGKDTGYKKPFMSHCFSCGRSTRTLDRLLTDIGRADLIFTETMDLEKPLVPVLFGLGNEAEEIDDSLVEVDLPDFYKRCYQNVYLTSRGFMFDDFDFFEVGTTRGFNFKFDDYVIFPIMDDGVAAGYVARHTWSKRDIDQHNRKAKRTGGYQLLRYRNSTDNDFVKLLYNYDSVVEGETDTVVIVEGVFDVVALYRKLNLYDNRLLAVVATFGKKISLTQIYKLQVKGVRTVVLAYDGDAVEATKHTAELLSAYFDVFIADVPYGLKDFDDMDFMEIHGVFGYGLKSPIEYRLTKLQL